MTTRTLAHYQFPIDRIREVEAAARAMLAALEAIANHKPTHFSRDDNARLVGTARAAIAAAKAAGIKVEG